MKVPCKNIPTYSESTEQWTTTSFDQQVNFADYLFTNCFKKPGKYEFTVKMIIKWQEHAKFFVDNGFYTLETQDTDRYNNYWDVEALKCRLGVLYYSENGNSYYLTRDYYFFINFCVIVNKEKGYEEKFADVRDGQYHMMLYEKIGEMYHNNTVVLKRRQFLFSFCHVAKTTNYLWFENRKRLKWFASDESFIDDVNGSWSIFNQYKTHLNNHTGWFRNFSPDKGGEAQQRQQVKIGGKWEWEGNESSLIGKTLKKDPKLGIGGPTFWAWYEEGGVAPTADITLQYMEPAITSGLMRVGSFCIGGSVGDLTECKPLKSFILEPSKSGFFAVDTDLYDESGVTRKCGLFIPAQYCMPEATDEAGNSLVELALELLHKAEFIGFKRGEYGRIADEPAWIELEPSLYILKKSQNPKTIKEAFDWRQASDFDIQKIERRQSVIKLLKEAKTFQMEQGLLEENEEDGKIRLKLVSEFKLNAPFENEYPVDLKAIEKRGLVNIYEKYNPKFNYYAGVDSIDSDESVTSKSLLSVHIYRRAYTEIDTTTNKRRTVPGKIVASWCGKFDRIDDTNEQGFMLLKMFKAKAACERNRPNFINHCRRNNFGHLIAKKSELPFNKDISTNISFSTLDKEEYGVWNDSGGVLLKNLIRNIKDYLNAEHDSITTDVKTDDGEIGKTTKVIRGYDIMDDYWTLEELKLYNKDGNFDRFISLALAIAYGTAEELSFEYKVQIASENKEQFKQPKPAPAIRNYLGGDRYSTINRKPRNLLKY